MSTQDTLESEVVRLPRDLTVLAVGSESHIGNRQHARRSGGRCGISKLALVNPWRLEQSGKGGNPEPRPQGDERNSCLKVLMRPEVSRSEPLRRPKRATIPELTAPEAQSGHREHPPWPHAVSVLTAHGRGLPDIPVSAIGPEGGM